MKWFIWFLLSVVLEEEIWRLQEENDKKDENISELRRGLEELKNDNLELEKKIQELTGES